MAYVKNCNPGKIAMDLPRANYIYELPLLSINDVHGPFTLSLMFTRAMAVNSLNPFFMAAGYKLNVHKYLNFDDPDDLFLVDGNGNRISVYEDNGVYIFEDNSQRIMKKVNSISEPYVIEYPDFSLEYYNQYGYITSVVDKYGVEVLSYTYNTSKKLTAVTYRGQKQVQFVYTNGKMTAIRYDGSTYNTTLSLGTGSTTIDHYSGVRYVLSYNGNTLFRAYTTTPSNSGTVFREVKVAKSENIFGITELVNGSAVKENVYRFPDYTGDPNENCSQVEINNDEGVMTRIHYQFGMPLYSYEIVHEDNLFIDNMYPSVVNIYNTLDSLAATQSACQLGRDNGLQMGIYDQSSHKWSRDITEYMSNHENGYFVLTGWVKSKATNTAFTETMIHISSHSSGSDVDFYPRIICDTKWQFFAYKVYLDDITNGNSLYVYPSSTSAIELKDLRLMFQTNTSSITEHSARVVLAEDVLITSANVCIPIRGSVFTCGNTMFECRENVDLTGTYDNYYVTLNDLLRYKVNQKKNNNTSEFYYNNGKAVITSNSAPSATVTYNGTQYYLSNCHVGKRMDTVRGVFLKRFRTNVSGKFLVCDFMTKSGTIVSTDVLDELLDVVSNTEAGVTTTYTRENGLVVEESVSGLYTRSMEYGDNTVTVTDEFGKETVYTMDSVWGVVTSVALPDGTIVTDEYDDGMSALTKRIFGNASGRYNSIEYSNNNISALHAGSLDYTFVHSADKLTKVTKDGTSVEEHEHDGNTHTDSYYPARSGALHSTSTTFDEYGRLLSIDGVLTNQYGYTPPKDTEGGVVIPRKVWGRASLATTTDELVSETAAFAYNYQGQLKGKVVTKESDSSDVISEESFTYDSINRMTNHTTTYTGTGFGAISGTTAYKKAATNPSADNMVSNYTYKVNGTRKAYTANSFDSYNRCYMKETTLTQGAYTQTLTFDKTRVTKAACTRQGVNLGTNTYTYDAMGRIKTDNYTAKNITGQYKRYTYDQYGQLIREDNQGLDKTFVYEYNNNGNITNVKAYSYTLNNTPSGTPTTTAFGYNTTYPDRLTSFGGSSIAYNAMGCPTSYDGKSATWSKGKLSRLSSGTLASGTNSYVYNYNAFGQRVSKTYSYLEGTSGLNPVQTGQVTAYTKKYYYDHAGRLLAEGMTKTVHGTGTVNERIVFLYDESSMVGMERTASGVSTLYYFQRNLQGDVTAIVDTNGNIIARYLYDAWGNCTISSDTTNTAVANANPIRYRGYYYDEDTGLYYCNARYYSPKWRRFISPDDTAYLDSESVNGLNLYCYCNNDPVNYSDPSGHMPKWLANVLTGIGIVVGTALFVTAIIASAGTVGALAGIGAATIGLSTTAISAVVTFATVSTYAVAGGVALFGLSDAIEVFSEGTNPIRDYIMGGNQTAYNVTSSVFNTLGSLASFAGMVGPKIIQNVARHGGTPKISHGRVVGHQRNYYDINGDWSFRIDATTHGNSASASWHHDPHYHVVNRGGDGTAVFYLWEVIKEWLGIK